jgi:hypothetical protein
MLCFPLLYSDSTYNPNYLSSVIETRAHNTLLTLELHGAFLEYALCSMNCSIGSIVSIKLDEASKKAVLSERADSGSAVAWVQR